jgi:hypothetical protein
LNIQTLGPDDTLSRDLPLPTASPQSTLQHNHLFGPMVDIPNESNYMEPVMQTSRSVNFDRHSLCLLSPHTSVPTMVNRNGGAIYANDLPALVAALTEPLVSGGEEVRTPTLLCPVSEESHLYMNVGKPSHEESGVARAPVQVLEVPDGHLYANLGLGPRPMPASNVIESPEEVVSSARVGDFILKNATQDHSLKDPKTEKFKNSPDVFYIYQTLF